MKFNLNKINCFKNNIKNIFYIFINCYRIYFNSMTIKKKKNLKN